ncbi:nuclear transport factor 2 family protein [Vannielia sp.]|uniref:nuclear transport factor 2 family protein n=1 Tax=Vannielia sp. TaxID=2813045 RepID=UPI00261089B4|nr:nuclear transport factor 2 family protein [Vannielia sp.]MDF1874074.1 nuclear transport factor 2 family protein [Vannielia sp.]
MTDFAALESAIWSAASAYDRAAIERLLAPDFFELSRSGRRYTREELLTDTSEGRPSAHRLHDLQSQPIAPGITLVTYRSETTTPDEVQWAARSTLWAETPAGWQARFHQGTPLPEAPRP